MQRGGANLHFTPVIIVSITNFFINIPGQLPPLIVKCPFTKTTATIPETRKPIRYSYLHKNLAMTKRNCSLIDFITFGQFYKPSSEKLESYN